MQRRWLRSNQWPAPWNACWPKGKEKGRLSPQSATQLFSHRVDVFVAAATAVEHHFSAVRECGAKGLQPGERMGRFQGRNDSLELTDKLQGGERFRVGHSTVFRTTNLPQVAVFRAHTGIVEASTDRMRLLNLAVLVLEEETHRTVQHTSTPFRHGRGMAPRLDPIACSFNPDQAHIRTGHKLMEQAHGVGTTPNTGQQDIRQAPEGFTALLARFFADHRMEIPNQHGIGMRSRH